MPVAVCQRDKVAGRPGQHVGLLSPAPGCGRNGNRGDPGSVAGKTVHLADMFPWLAQLS